MTNSTLNLHTREPGFIWNEKCKDTFNANLVSERIKSKLESLLISDELKPTQLAHELKNTLLLIANRYKLKKSSPPDEKGPYHSLTRNVSPPKQYKG